MKVFALLTLFAGLVVSTPLPPVQRRAAVSSNETDSLLSALNNSNLTSLANFFVAHPNVLQQVMYSPGLKTLLAPTNEAMQGIPLWCTSNSTCYESTMLMHILNGTFPVNYLSQEPIHTIGHSFLTNEYFAHLPGGNGQAVALSIRQQSSSNSKRAVATWELAEVSKVRGQILAISTPIGRINEALNNNRFTTSQAQQQVVGNFTIQPIARAMTVPGTATSTLKLLKQYTRFVQLIESQPNTLATTIDDMRGVTIFAPTDEAIEQFQQDNPDLSAEELTVIILNHIIAFRAVYSPLLKSQGSMITMAGQDLLFESANKTVSVGKNSAKLSQLDIMHRGGVIHSLDSVLANTNLDAQRAVRASNSASASANSFVAGPVSMQNTASSQGGDVPMSLDAASKARGNVNSTVTTFDATRNGTDLAAIPGAMGTGVQASITNTAPVSNATSTPNSAAHMSKRCGLITFAISLLTLLVLLF